MTKAQLGKLLGIAPAELKHYDLQGLHQKAALANSAQLSTYVIWLKGGK